MQCDLNIYKKRLRRSISSNHEWGSYQMFARFIWIVGSDWFQLSLASRVEQNKIWLKLLKLKPARLYCWASECLIQPLTAIGNLITSYIKLFMLMPDIETAPGPLKVFNLIM